MTLRGRKAGKEGSLRKEGGRGEGCTEEATAVLELEDAGVPPGHLFERLDWENTGQDTMRAPAKGK